MQNQKPRISDNWSSTARTNSLLLIAGFCFFSLFSFNRFIESIYGLYVETWENTPGLIQESRVLPGGGRSGPSPSIVYSYTVDGQSYQNDRINFGVWSWGGIEGLQQLINKYPVGKSVPIYYLSEDPKQSVLRFEGTVLGDFLQFLIATTTLILVIYFRFFKRVP